MSEQLTRLNGIKAFLQVAIQQSSPDRVILGLENDGAPPGRVPPEGRIVLRRGEPGRPTQVTLNPVTYYYDHQIPFEISTVDNPDRDMTAIQVAAEILDAMSSAIEADRTAGETVDYLDAFAPTLDDLYVAGGANAFSAEGALTASYSTTKPL